MFSPEDIQDEQIRMAKLRVLVDLTSQLLRHPSLSRHEAFQLIEDVRERVLALCSGKGEVFDLILRPRFLRILDERALEEWGLTDCLN